MRDSSRGSGIALLPRTPVYTASPSAKERMKINCRVGHHFVGPNPLETNGIMPPIIHIVHPMVAVIVTGEILGVLERHPLPIFLPVGGMIGHFVE